ncbi:MAG: Ig-like domain-containing protein [Cyclobacteriaceae bacterium]
MKKIQYTRLSIVALLGYCMTILTSCDRDLSEDVRIATFSNTAEIFTDNFIGLGSDFYFPFVPDGAKPDVFSVDDQVAYEGTSSIRIDVPNADDPAGGFAGANFVVDGAGRDLTGYDALTFWARASQAATIGEIGIGEKFRSAASNVDFTTAWQKFIIPLADPSRHTEERTVFGFSAGGIGDVPGEEVGFSFWIDELKFEKLGTIAQPRPSILAGEDVVIESFIGVEEKLVPFAQTFNLEDGSDQTVFTTSAYLKFSSSNAGVASVDETGNVTMLSKGTATITATLANVRASGSLTVDVLGEFEFAPTPPARDAADVISIFSDSYENQPGFQPAVFNNADIQIAVPTIAGNAILSYNSLSFVGLGWDGTSDVSGLAFLHVDVQVQGSLSPSDALTVEILDFGANNADGGGDDTAGGKTIPGTDLKEGEWVGIDIPVNGFVNGTGGGGAGSPNLKNVARVIFVGSGSTSEILVDNIYFYK